MLPPDARPRYLAATFAVFGIAALYVLVSSVPRDPANFAGPTIVEVAEGEGLASVARHLENAGVIHSAFWFRTIAIAREGESTLLAGAYRFNEPVAEYEAVTRLLSGDYGILEYRVTFPEGFTAAQVAARIASTTGNAVFMEQIDAFLAAEGYLFPETYFLDERSTPESVIEAMREEFAERATDLGLIDDVAYEFYDRVYRKEDIVTMASIVEGEANTPESRRMVADILWRRLARGMPLQVDATLQYSTGRGSAELTKDDLASEDPYNTYMFRGLPPTPINNPGEDAFAATLKPTANQYLYFLTGDDGEMYYARTFEEHLKNQRAQIQSID